MVLPPKEVSIEPDLPVWEESTSVPSPLPEPSIMEQISPAEPSWFALALFVVGMMARYLRSQNTHTRRKSQVDKA